MGLNIGIAALVIGSGMIVYGNSHVNDDYQSYLSRNTFIDTVALQSAGSDSSRAYQLRQNYNDMKKVDQEFLYAGLAIAVFGAMSMRRRESDNDRNRGRKLMAKVVEWSTRGITGIGWIVEETEAMPGRETAPTDAVSNIWNYYPQIDEKESMLRELVNVYYSITGTRRMSRAVRRLENAEERFGGPVSIARHPQAKYWRRA